MIKFLKLFKLHMLQCLNNKLIVTALKMKKHLSTIALSSKGKFKCYFNKYGLVI